MKRLLLLIRQPRFHVGQDYGCWSPEQCLQPGAGGQRPEGKGCTLHVIRARDVYDSQFLLHRKPAWAVISPAVNSLQLPLWERSQIVQQQEGMQLEMKRTTSGSGNLNCCLFIISGTQMDLLNARLDSVQY